MGDSGGIVDFGDGVYCALEVGGWRVLEVEATVGENSEGVCEKGGCMFEEGVAELCGPRRRE